MLSFMKANQATSVSDTHPMPVAVDSVADAATTTNSVTSAATITTLSTAGYGAGSFQISSIGSGNTVLFEHSNNGVDWVPLTTNLDGNTFSQYSSTATVVGLYSFTVTAAYVRAKVSVYGSGTVTITSLLKRQRPAGDRSTQVVIGTGTSAIGSLLAYTGYTDSTTALGSGATYTGTGRATTSTAFASRFKARAYSDQAGTLYIDQSLDSGSTWQVVTSVALTAGTSVDLSAVTTGAAGAANQFRVRYVNGGTAQGILRLSSAFAQN